MALKVAPSIMRPSSETEIHQQQQTCGVTSPKVDLLIPLPLLTSGRSKKKDKCKNTQMYPLSETQYCPCDKYNAQPVGNWSDCILPEGGRVETVLGMKVQGDIKECGQGYRYQAMVCYDQDNRLVETSRCNSHGESACMCVCLSPQTFCHRACCFIKGAVHQKTYL